MDNPHVHNEWFISSDFYVKGTCNGIEYSMALVLKNHYIRINTPEEFSCTT